MCQKNYILIFEKIWWHWGFFYIFWAMINFEIEYMVNRVEILLLKNQELRTKN